MSIRRKFFLTLVSSLLALFLFFSGLSIFYFRNTVRRNLDESMKTLISYNTNISNTFMASVNQVALHLVSDKAFGELLSFEGDRMIEQIENRDAIHTQFAHYSLFYNTDYTHFENVLFLDEDLPAAELFPIADMSEAVRLGSYRIYKDTLVKSQSWYERLSDRRVTTHVIYDELSDKLLFVRRLQNTYYTGPWRKEGIGTLVVYISPEDFGSLLTMQSLTPNSAYIITNARNEVLLEKNTNEALRDYFTAEDFSERDIPKDGLDVTADGKDWKVYRRTLRNDVQIIYLTPYSDVKVLIWDSLKPSLILSAAFLLLTGILAYVFSAYFTKPIIKLSKDISEIDDTTSFDARIFDSYKDLELQVLCHSFEDMIKNSNQLIEARQESERKSREMELRSLQAQINPHFLFNAMDLVNWIALSRGQDDLADIVSNIAEILRYSITEADSLIPIKDEIRICRTYLSIYRLRYGNLMEFTYPDEAELDYYLPKFCIQPLVENSIRHSSETHDEPLYIDLAQKKEDGMIELRLTDSGRGADPELLNRYLRHEPNVPLKVSNGFGIRNVNERLRLKSGGTASLHYEADDEDRLCAVLRFPYVSNTKDFLKGAIDGKERKDQDA